MSNKVQKASAWLWWLANRRPHLMAMLGGLLMALSFPPLPLAFLSFVAWLPLVVAIEAALFPSNGLKTTHFRTFWRVFKRAYLFFLVWNLGVNYWLMFSGWNMPDAGTRLSGLLSGALANVANPALQSLPVLLYAFARQQVPLGWAFGALVASYIGFEHSHFNWELTWSWTTLGNALALWPFYIQYLEFTGVQGASVFILLANWILALVWDRGRRQRLVPMRLWARLAILLCLPLALWPLLTAGGREVFQPSGYINVRVVQPNIDPYDEKFSHDEDELYAQMEQMAGQITAPGIDSIQLAVLPESNIPGRIPEQAVAQYPYLRPFYQAIARHPQLNILTGIIAMREYHPSLAELPVSARCVGEKCFDIYNAATMLGHGITPRVYAKSKLVPFSERPPFMETFRMLKDYNLDLGGGFGAFAFPDSIVMLRTSQGEVVAPVICYESIFPGYVRQLAERGAGLLCILTNDGWWKQTSGYLQHAAFARLRAIETRRAIARSANTGLSLLVSPSGQVLAKTSWWVPARLDAKLPLLKSQTFFVRNGDYVGWMCLLATPLLLAFAYVHGRRQRALKRQSNASSINNSTEQPEKT